MTLTQLSYIVAVDKYKNFGQAAESCQVTQPTLSMQIHKLEEELGIVFFDRSTQPVRTTKAALPLMAQARLILSESQKFMDLVSEEQGEVRGEVSLAVIPTLAPYLTPLFIKKFSEKHPTLKISIEEIQTHEILHRLKENTLDVGILVTPIEDEKLVTTPLFYEPFLFYCSEKNALFGKTRILQSELSTNDLWMLSEGHCFRDQTLAVCRSKKKSVDDKRSIKFEGGSLETLRRMVDQESGFTLLPQLATADLQGSKRLKEFAPPVPMREVSLIHSSFFNRKALRDSLVDSIKKSIPKELPQIVSKSAQVVSLPIGKATSI
jgi:LysR family transcriptional regulator, hydrogen peroxide-inducible genes activator